VEQEAEQKALEEVFEEGEEQGEGLPAQKLSNKIVEIAKERQMGIILEDLSGIKERIVNNSKELKRKLSKWNARELQSERVRPFNPDGSFFAVYIYMRDYHNRCY